jgi:hypothetical protein
MIWGCVCLQVCCQPSFAAVEDGLLSRRCSCINKSGNSTDTTGASSDGTNSSRTSTSSSRRKLWLVSLVFRSAYVGFTTLVAVALPFFAVILGLVAALTFYQTGVLYPVLLHRAVYPCKRAGALLMNVVLVVAGAVIALVVVGSVAVIVMSASSLSPLKAP